jgi:putative transposase
MQKAFQYRLYPTQEQEGLFLDTLETLRHLYNGALAERIDAYQHENRTIGYLEQQNRLPALKKMAEPLRNCYSQVAQDCLRRLDLAYQNFFRRVKLGLEKPGFPRFKGVGRYRSFTYPCYGSAAKIEGKLLHLSKIGDIPVRLHRPLEGTPKTCTISRKADGWYCSIASEIQCAEALNLGCPERASYEVEAKPLEKTGQDVGIDVGIENFATLSDDHPAIPNPRLLHKAQAGLRKAQRRLERRTRRDKNHKLTSHQSRRRAKAKVLLAKAHQRVQRARLDFHHKVVHALVHQFDTLYVENLNIQGMLKNHHLAKAISDVGWGQFFCVLKQQAASAAKHVVEVCPRNTSQIRGLSDGNRKRTPGRGNKRYDNARCVLEREFADSRTTPNTLPPLDRFQSSGGGVLPAAVLRAGREAGTASGVGGILGRCHRGILAVPLAPPDPGDGGAALVLSDSHRHDATAVAVRSDSPLGRRADRISAAARRAGGADGSRRADRRLCAAARTHAESRLTPSGVCAVFAGFSGDSIHLGR